MKVAHLIVAATTAIIIGSASYWAYRSDSRDTASVSPPSPIPGAPSEVVNSGEAAPAEEPARVSTQTFQLPATNAVGAYVDKRTAAPAP